MVPEAVFDAGPVDKGESVTHDFTVKNEGDAVLEITSVKPTCGCTVVDYDKTISPGQVGRVTARVDTANFTGGIAKSVRVYTNDSLNPEITLVVKANIKVRVEVDPGYARFIAVYGEPQKTNTQLIWSEEKPDLQVLTVSSPYPFVSATVREASDDEKRSGISGRQWSLDIALAKDAPVGPMADFIVVTTDHPQMKTVRVPLSGFVRPVLSVTPRIADFGRRELNEPQTTSLEVRNLGSADVTLGEVTSSLPGVAAEIEAIEEGRVYKVLLTLSKDMPKGAFDGSVSISTSSGKQPTVEFDVKGVVL